MVWPPSHPHFSGLWLSQAHFHPPTHTYTLCKWNKPSACYKDILNHRPACPWPAFKGVYLHTNPFNPHVTASFREPNKGYYPQLREQFSYFLDSTISEHKITPRLFDIILLLKLKWTFKGSVLINSVPLTKLSVVSW